MNNETVFVKPFSNGTEAMNWKEHNCDQCKLYDNISTDEDMAGCKSAFHVDLGFITGEIPLMYAEQIGSKLHDGKFVKLTNCKLKQQ